MFHILRFVRVRAAVCVVAAASTLSAQNPQPAAPEADRSAPGPLPSAAQQSAQNSQIPEIIRPERERWYQRFTLRYAPSFVPPVPFANSSRLGALVRAGNLYLSLQDAIALALENNLDVELQRFEPRIGDTELMRAQGGGTLRGIPLTANETPTGVGGPSAPLLNVAASGGAPSTGSIVTSVSDVFPLTGGATNLNFSAGTFATGPIVPIFDPALVGTVQFLRQNTPQTNPIITGGTSLTQNTASGVLGYEQGFSTGTDIRVSSNTSRISSNSTRLVFNPYANQATTVNIVQPLLRGFGSGVNRRFIRIAKNERRLADSVFRQQIIGTVSGIVRLYWDLVGLNEDLRVRRQTLALAQKLYQDNRAQVEAGTLAPLELTRAQAYVAAARQDVANAEGFVAQQELILKSQLVRRLSDEPLLTTLRIIPTDPITIPEIDEARPVQDLVNEAFRSRPELEAARLQIDNAHISLEGSKNALLPDVSIVGTLGGTGLAGQPNPLLATTGPGGLTQTPPTTGLGGAWTALGQMFALNYPTYGVGLQLTLPLRNRVAQADYARDVITLRQTEIRNQQLQNQVRLEIENALVVLARSRAALNAATESRMLQEQSLDVEQKKYAVGLSTTYMVLQYQSFVAQARSTEVATRSTYVKARNALIRAIGGTLDTYNVSLDEAWRGQIARPPDPIPAVVPGDVAPGRVVPNGAAPAPPTTPSR